MAEDARSEDFLTNWPDHDKGPWAITLRFQVVTGRVECTALRVEPADEHQPKVLDKRVLQRIPLGRLIDEVCENAPIELVALAGLPAWSTLGARAQIGLDLLASKRGGRPATYGNEHFEQVAKIYLSSPSKPTASVAAHFRVSRSAAAKWVRRARDLGLLAPTTRGRRSGIAAGDVPDPNARRISEERE